MDELKPCPFCGSDDVGFTQMRLRDEGRYKDMHITCGMCEASIAEQMCYSEFVNLTTEEQSKKLSKRLTASWNRRVYCEEH